MVLVVVDDVFIVKAAPLPAGGALKVMSGQKIVMEGTATGLDTVSVAASVAKFRRLYCITFRGRVINGEYKLYRCRSC